jgi:hypothetical protein
LRHGLLCLFPGWLLLYLDVCIDALMSAHSPALVNKTFNRSISYKDFELKNEATVYEVKSKNQANNKRSKGSFEDSKSNDSYDDDKPPPPSKKQKSGFNM